MIRLAVDTDRKDMVILAKEFIKQGPEFFEFNREYLENTIDFCINNEDGLAVVYETNGVVAGMLLAMCSMHPMFGYLHTTELCWYVKEGMRGSFSSVKLLKAFVEWSEFKKAEYMIVSSVRCVKDLESFYIKLGFTPAENTYFRKV